MKKADIPTRIHEMAGISDREANDVFDWILELLKSTLQRGEDIIIAGFGKFRVRSKNARAGRNPRTGEEIHIPARRVVTFHASGLLKDYIVGTHQEGGEPGP